MKEISSILTPYIPYLVLGLSFMMILLFLLVLILWIKLRRLKKRYNFFTGGNRRPDHNLEIQMRDYMEKVKDVQEKYGKVVDVVNDIRENVTGCTQKIGIVRYNPFEEIGGNLSFAIAILDGKDNGIVLNGIHSRTGTFTYAKPVESGVSTYVLCEEELQAIEEAKKSAHAPIKEELQAEKKIKIYKVVVPVKEKKKRESEIEQKQEKENKIQLEKIHPVETMTQKEQIKTEETVTSKKEIDEAIEEKKPENFPSEETKDIITLKEIVLGNIIEKN